MQCTFVRGDTDASDGTISIGGGLRAPLPQQGALVLGPEPPEPDPGMVLTHIAPGVFLPEPKYRELLQYVADTKRRIRWVRAQQEAVILRMERELNALRHERREQRKSAPAAPPSSPAGWRHALQMELVDEN